MSPIGLSPERLESKGRAGINQSGCRYLDLPRGSPSLETSAKAGGREAKTLTSLASTPCAASGSY